MDVDVVPGSVTFWTVTLDDQRRLKWAMVRLRLRSWSYWVLGLVLPALMTGSGWFGSRDLGLDPLSDAVALVMILTFGIACSALMLPLPLWIVPRRVKRELPVGATLVAWTTESGLGVRTPSRLTFYPWSRLTQVEAGPVLVRCRQEGARTLAVPAYLPAGPDELARSIDFPAQLIGADIRHELAQRAGRESVEVPLAGEPTVVDRALRRRLIRAWLWTRFGITAPFGIMAWLVPVAIALNVAVHLAGGSYRMAAFLVVVILCNPFIWLLSGEGRMSGMYPVGATVTGSVGESLEIQGPWGSVAWHRGWLRQRRMTAHTVTYEVMQTNADGSPAQLIDVEKRIVVIPRAFLDTPTPAVSTEV